MAFHVGQRVVRVGSYVGRGPKSISAALAASMGYSYPEIGEVVTIKTLNVWSHGTTLTFHEHDNTHVQRQLGSAWEPGFNSQAFRPLTDTKQQTSFTEGAPKDSEKWDGRRKVKEHA